MTHRCEPKIPFARGLFLGPVGHIQRAFFLWNSCFLLIKDHRGRSADEPLSIVKKPLPFGGSGPSLPGSQASGDGAALDDTGNSGSLPAS